MRTTSWVAGLCVWLSIAPAVFAQSTDEVGDSDSFDRAAIHLGMAETTWLKSLPDCASDLARGHRCTVLRPPAEITSWTLTDLDSIELPSRAAHSLLCFEYTPFIETTLKNTTNTANASAFWLARGRLTIRSVVLDDPTLVRPGTGLPYGGELTIQLSSWSERVTLSPGQEVSKGIDYTRRCGQSALSKARLRTVFGFSTAQANAFFNNPITLVLGATGETRFGTKLEMQYNLRVFGDRR
jgi:hypothetical protein